MRLAFCLMEDEAAEDANEPKMVTEERLNASQGYQSHSAGALRLAVDVQDLYFNFRPASL